MEGLCGCMLQSGVGKKVLPTSSPSHLSGGAFSVPKSVICPGLHDSDVSCYQVIVSSVFISVTFQIVTTLRVLMRRGYSGKCWVRGFQCPGLENWRTRVWICCLLKDLSLGCPVILSKNPTQETVDPHRYCLIAVAAVIMGDWNAVCDVEAAHRRQLLSAGSLQTRTMLIPYCAFLRSATIGDVHVDDLVIPAMVHFSRLHLKDD